MKKNIFILLSSVVIFSIFIFLSCKEETVTPYFDFEKTVYDTSSINVFFKNESEGGVSYKWDFGDGESKNCFLPEDGFHTYKRGGTYNVTLTVVGNDETKSITRTVNIKNLVPDFEIIEYDTLSFNKVHFKLINDFDTLGNVKILWDYGDGEKDITNKEEHFYFFKNGGNQSVTLRLVRGNDEIVEITKSMMLPVLEPDFEAKVLNISNRNNFTFYDISKNVINTSETREGKSNPDEIKIKYHWNYGNGVDSSYIIPDDFNFQDSINYEYPEGGDYTVSLTITQGEETKEVIKSISIPTMDIDFEIKLFENSLDSNEVKFIPISHYNNAKYTWDFGDGETIKDEDNIPIEYSYTNGGIYAVTLTVKKGSEIVQTSKVVNLPVLGVDFEAEIDPDNHRVVNLEPKIKNSSNVESYTWEFGDGEIITRNDTETTTS